MDARRSDFHALLAPHARAILDLSIKELLDHERFVLAVSWTQLLDGDLSGIACVSFELRGGASYNADARHLMGVAPLQLIPVLDRFADSLQLLAELVVVALGADVDVVATRAGITVTPMR